MNYTVKKLAKLSGVTVRTLHYYDEIGLLKPAHVARNGYRYYTGAELARLQQIMFFRELDMPLAEIARLLDDPSFDRAGALASHRAALEASAGRIRELIATIDKTLAELDGERTMSDQEYFEGFDPEKQAEYEQELVKEWGVDPRRIEESRERVGKFDDTDKREITNEYDRLHREFAKFCEEDADPASAPVQALVEDHFALINRFWDASPQAYAALGRMYTEHAGFRKTYERYHPKLAGYLASAMKVFAAHA